MPSSTGHSQLTHVNVHGSARMVDVTAKPITARSATAVGSVQMSPTARDLLAAGDLAKGDALAVARIAGIAAAKRTPDLIPLCHPVAIGSVVVDVVPCAEGVRITATVATADRTGIEMEALTCVTVAALTVVDMVKAVDRNATIGETRVVAKSGGRSGDWTVDAAGCLAVTSQEEIPSDLPLAGRRALVVTVSDRRFAGVADDIAGPTAVDMLTALGATVSGVVVADGVEGPQQVVGRAVQEGIDVVITTGGTGIGPRDLTPEALEPLVARRLPGVEQAIRAAAGTPLGAMSRTVVGVCRATLVAALPGSPKAVAEGLGVLRPLWAHLCDQIAGGDHDPSAEHCDSPRPGQHAHSGERP